MWERLGPEIDILQCKHVTLMFTYIARREFNNFCNDIYRGHAIVSLQSNLSITLTIKSIIVRNVDILQFFKMIIILLRGIIIFFVNIKVLIDIGVLEKFMLFRRQK